MKFRSDDVRTAVWLLLALLSTAGFSVPFFIHSASGYAYLGFAHETLAYRYFFNLRVLDGQGSVVWLPQGQFLSTLQHGIAGMVSEIWGRSLFDLKSTLDLYSVLTNLLVLLAYFGVAVVASRSMNLSWFDRALVLLVAPVIVLGVREVGHYYVLLPDYLAVSIVFIAAAVLIVLRLLRSRASFSWGSLVAAGAFCGLAASNKLTLAGPAGLAVLLVAARTPLNLPTFLGRLGLAASVAICAFLLVFLACYLFDVRETLRAFAHWFRYLREAQAEGGQFWEKNFRNFLINYNYVYIISAFALALVLFALMVARKKAWISRAGILLGGVVLVTVLLFAGLLKRGAGTTLFELSCILVGLTAISLAVSLEARHNRLVCSGIVVVVLTTVLLQFEYRRNWQTSERWGEMARDAWNVNEAIRQVNGHVEILEPDPSYAWSSVEELIDIGLGLSARWGFGISRPLDQYDLHLPNPPIAKSRAMKNIMSPNATVRYSATPSGDGSAAAIMWYEKWNLASDRPLRETDADEASKWPELERMLAEMSSCRYWRVGLERDRRVGLCKVNKAP